MPTPGSPSGARTQNTMSEGLTGILQQVAYMQTLPDADLERLSGLQMILLNMIRGPMAQQLQSQGPLMAGNAPALGSAASPMTPSAMGGPPGMGGPPMGGPPPGAMPPMGGGGVPSGLRNGIALPPVDELRRLVSGANQ